MKKSNVRVERGVLKMDNNEMRDYLKNIEIVALINSDSIEYTILNKNDIDYIFSNSEFHFVEDDLTKKLSVLSQKMTNYLNDYDSIENVTCYDLSFENLSKINSSHQKIKNIKGELIFNYKRFELNQRKRSHLENEIHQLIIDVNNIIVRALSDAFDRCEIDYKYINRH